MNVNSQTKKSVLSKKSELGAKVCSVDEPKRERQIQRVGKRQTDGGNVGKREEYREWRKESETDRLNGERERDRQRKWRKERERQRMRMRGDVVTV